ncbi:MAG: RDD family protein [Candidatus Auribacterota bacterium]
MARIKDVTIQEQCPDHPEEVLIWECDTCSKRMCKECDAVGFKYKIYCQECIKKIDSAPVETTMYPVGVLKRLGARGVDLVVLILINVLLLIVPAFFFKPLLFVSYAVVSYVLTVVYFTLLTAKMGQTPGKMALEIKIINDKHKPPSYFAATMRYILGLTLGFFYVLGMVMFYSNLQLGMGATHLASVFDFLREYHRFGISSAMKAFYSFLLVMMAVDGVFIMFNQKKQALHDYLARTMVILDL